MSKWWKVTLVPAETGEETIYVEVEDGGDWIDADAVAENDMLLKTGMEWDAIEEEEVDIDEVPKDLRTQSL